MAKNNRIPAHSLVNHDEYYNAEGDDDTLDPSDHPVSVDGKIVDKKNLYLYAQGDEYYNADGDEYSYIDANDEQDVTNFQRYANSRGAGLQVDGKYGNKTKKQYKKYGAEYEALKNPQAIAPLNTLPTSNPYIGALTEAVPVVPRGTQPTVAQMEEQKKKGVFWDKAKGVWITAKQSGALDLLAGLFGTKKPRPNQAISGGGAVSLPAKGMSKGVKIVLGVAGLVLLGFAVHSLLKHSPARA